jgi:hypothetical protein
MALTTERLLFLRPGVGPGYTLLAWVHDLLQTFIRNPRKPPLIKPVDVCLVDIERFWKWSPDFSGFPAYQIGNELYWFVLKENRHPWRRPAAIEAMREHFEAVEAAWAAAKARAALRAPTS